MRWLERVRERQLARRKARKESYVKEIRQETNEAVKELKLDQEFNQIDGPFIKPNEAAEIIGKNTNILQKLRASGDGPKFYKLGRSVRYKKEDIENWMAETNS